MRILDMFCSVDDFWQEFGPQWEQSLLLSGGKQRHRDGQMHPSEVMTLAIHFHQSGFRTFKGYYTNYVQGQLRREFPQLVSYGRMVELLKSVLVPLAAYLQTHLGRCSGISFVDSTALKVCHNARIHAHRVFAGRAQRGKTSVGWFYGFKLHLVISDQGELLAFALTPGNVDDRQPVPQLAQCLLGKLIGDKGYLSQALADRLFTEQGIQFLTKVRKNMPERIHDAWDKLLLRQRAVIESAFDVLKNGCQIEHSRHRSSSNFLTHLIAGLTAYTHLPTKPSLHLRWLALPAA